MFVLLFDIDGTLLSSGGAGKAAMESALMEEFGLGELLGRVPYSGRTDRAIAQDLLRLHGVAESEANWQRLREGYLSRLPRCLAAHQGQVLPGIAALLECLRARGDITLGLLTGNIREGARLKLGHYGLHEHFTFGGFGDLHFHRDDVAREALAAVHGHLNGTVPLERLWVIGDTPLDVACARAIGARVAAVATGWHSLEELADAGPDLLLADFTDPAPLLAELDQLNLGRLRLNGPNRHSC
jgi:phosphoglycolate phosphatase-like HAD superfamily hydrolase